LIQIWDLRNRLDCRFTFQFMLRFCPFMLKGGRLLLKISKLLNIGINIHILRRFLWWRSIWKLVLWRVEASIIDRGSICVFFESIARLSYEVIWKVKVMCVSSLMRFISSPFCFKTNFDSFFIHWGWGSRRWDTCVSLWDLSSSLLRYSHWTVLNTSAGSLD